MAHDRIVFPMPVSCEVVFDVFHYHHWRARWDSLVSHTEVDGGAPCPHVGAVSHNIGSGLLGRLSMRTEFVSYQRPRLAAARMLCTSFPFSKWAASIRHEPAAGGSSVLIYTYNIEAGPRMLRWLIEPMVHHMFRRQTVKRFERMCAFLSTNANEVEAWQRVHHSVSSTDVL